VLAGPAVVATELVDLRQHLQVPLHCPATAATDPATSWAAAVLLLAAGTQQLQELLLGPAAAAVWVQHPRPGHRCQLTHQGIAVELVLASLAAGVCWWCM
jgi:hypothetical protein